MERDRERDGERWREKKGESLYKWVTPRFHSLLNIIASER
jgi:hypothetical protein